MIENRKHFFIPAAALVCFGVENAPGALPCEGALQKNHMCDPYSLNFIEAKTPQTTIEESAKKENLTLYNRTAKEPAKHKEIATAKVKTSKTLKKPSRPAPKKIVKNAKDVTLPKIQTASKEATTPKKSIETYTYVVNKGDTLSQIAKEFNLPIKTLKELNNLQEPTLVAGQKLKIPKNAKKVVSNQSVYTVQAGDTLEAIAKRFNITLNKLMKYNALKDHTIKSGQKLYLKYTKVAKATPKASKIKKVFKTANNNKAKKGVRVLKVTATAYTSHVGQTDKTPFLAAWNNRIRPGMKIIAVSRDLIKKYGLTNGKKVKIKGLPGVYTVKDKMNKRFKKRIDIYMGLNKRKALEWGKKKIVIMF